MNRIGAGVIGLGVGAQHAYGYDDTEGCYLAGLCDLSEEKLREVSAQYPAAATTTSWQDLLAVPGIDVVSIASYDDAHCKQTIECLNAGKHVFVEKPVCRSLAEMQQIRAALASRDDLHLGSNLVLRAAPVYRWLRDEIAAGRLGEIYAFDGEYLYGRIHKITGGWRRNVDGYSVMLGGGVHMADLMLWLTGQRPETVISHGNQICTAGTEFRYPDFVTSTFTFPSGLIGRITANFGCVHRHQHVLRIYGSKGTFLLDDAGARVHRSRDPETAAETLDMNLLPDRKWDLIPDFIARTRSASRLIENQQEFDTICVCLAADESLRVRSSVGVTYS